MKIKRFSWKQRMESISFALEGLNVLVREEHNFRLHMVASAMVVMAGFLLQLCITEWIVVTFCIAMVYILEAINSAIENLCDFVEPKKHDQIKKIKDIAAGAVLIGAIAAAVIGTLVFVPKIWEIYFKN